MWISPPLLSHPKEAATSEYRFQNQPPRGDSFGVFQLRKKNNWRWILFDCALSLIKI
ncbi:hypothetical protein Sjap_023432 [Stephania japonica]|uniref:Uncharacterized protein n=1 Tax=Stephania japonica TaxID=461633 RepID=A0AAP0HP82_9MAGN